MKYVFRIALAIILSTSFSTSFAQESSDEIASLKAFINNMYSDYFSANNTGTLEEYTVLFDPRFKGNDVEVDIQGEVSILQQDLASMLKTYKRLSSDKTAQVKYNLNQYRSAYVKGATGVAVFDVDFEITKNDEVISKGQQTISFILKKSRDTWKITYMDRVYVQSEVYQGNCFCELFTQGDQFATFLTVPDGDEYITVNDRFELLESPQRRAIRRNGDEMYDWNKSNGELTLGDERVGNAMTTTTAINAILKYNNADRCQRVRTK